MMNLNEMKNDTARAKAIREELARLVSEMLVEKFGAENVVDIPNKITVNGSDISGNTVAVRVGSVTVDGFECDAVATISATVKAWKDKPIKGKSTVLAVTLGDIADEVKIDSEIKAEDKAKKEKAKVEKLAKKDKAKSDKSDGSADAE
jgi:hypothetical protein